MSDTSSPSALVTGITGQDGYYLTRLLLEKGYRVHGVVRRASTMNRQRIDQLRLEMPAAVDRIELHYGDVTDAGGMMRMLMHLRPDEVYNLAANSHVRVSFEQPAYTHAVNAIGTLNMLEATRMLADEQPVKFYQASTSEIFGGMPGTAPQNEQTPLHPRSPYGCAKAAAYHQVINHRESCGLFACNGILFNHESPHRGENFVTRKITLAAARIKHGLQNQLALGNLDAQRDWGFAGDYVEAMWLMLQQDEPDDFVIATGQMHSVGELLKTAFTHAGLDADKHVTIDPRYFRPAEVMTLCGDASKAQQRLGWEPRRSFAQLVQMMVDHDMQQTVSEAHKSDAPARTS